MVLGEGPVRKPVKSSSKSKTKSRAAPSKRVAATKASKSAAAKTKAAKSKPAKARAKKNAKAKPAKKTSPLPPTRRAAASSSTLTGAKSRRERRDAAAVPRHRNIQSDCRFDEMANRRLRLIRRAAPSLDRCGVWGNDNSRVAGALDALFLANLCGSCAVPRYDVPYPKDALGALQSSRGSNTNFSTLCATAPITGNGC